MNATKTWGLTGLLLLATAAAVPAGSYGPRQYYTGWSSTSYGYYYRTYYYKPYPTYPTYGYHYVVYYPSRPYYYYYNPVRRVYWGRVPVDNDGKAAYSLLAEKDRKGTLAEIKEEQFPKPGAMPSVPEAKDDVKIDVPPRDPPTGNDLPKR
jgi:hypothetical protein